MKEIILEEFFKIELKDKNFVTVFWIEDSVVLRIK